MSLAVDGLQGGWIQEGKDADGRGPRIVARTLFREMQRSGFTPRQVLAVADELLGCLCATARHEAIASADSWKPDGTGGSGTPGGRR